MKNDAGDRRNVDWNASRHGLRGGVARHRSRTGAGLDPTFGGASEAEVEAACSLAAAAFDTYRSTSLEQRAAFLEAIAQGIVDLGDTLVDRVMSESGLPRPRVERERARTAAQLRLFASNIRKYDNHSLESLSVDSSIAGVDERSRVTTRLREEPLDAAAIASRTHSSPGETH